MAKNEVAPTGQKTIAQFLNMENTKKYIQNILQDRAAQFTSSLVSLANLTYGLSKCDPQTLMFCGLKAASLNLPLDNNLGFAYAVPYGKEASFQIGYRGLVQLAQRTGQYKKINVIDIRKDELIKWDPFTEELELVIEGDPVKRDKLLIIGYAAMFELANGYTKVNYWPKEKVEKHGKRFSKTYNNGPWKTDFDAMAKKTVLKELISKWGPMSIEMQEAVKFDQSVIREAPDGTEYPDYVDADFEVKETPFNSRAEEEFKAEQTGGDANAGGEQGELL